MDIKTSSLSEIESRQLWEGIKKSDPALADLMSNDPFVQELKEVFNAGFQFKSSELNRFINIGKIEIGKMGLNKNNGNT